LKKILNFLKSNVLSFLAIVVISLLVLGLLAYRQLGISVEKVVDFKPALTSKIYDRHGNLVANIFDEENRMYAKFDEIPHELIEALLAIEDTAFFEHNGVNPDAVVRAAVRGISAGRAVQGASTLTQQLVKNMLLTREKTFTRKFKEVLLAMRVETRLSKEEILERYLNYVFLGHGYFGIKTAADGYFRKSLNELTLKEMAILVGIPKAPSSYDPTRRLERSLERANVVLLRLKSLGWISEGEYKKAHAEVPKIYNDTLTQNKAPYLVDAAVAEVSKLYPDIKTGGYSIKVFADLTVQHMAQKALKNGYEAILNRTAIENSKIDDLNLKNSEIAAKRNRAFVPREKFDTTKLNGAIIVTNPTNGEILALVGGVDHEKSSFNRVTQSVRQPGSSFKPFVYQIAIDNGYNPMTMVADISRIFRKVDGVSRVEASESGEDVAGAGATGGSGGAKVESWKPKNFGSTLDGQVTLADALRRSRNLATINLLGSIGFGKVWRVLKFEYGFENAAENLSIALGSFEVSLFDFSQKYSMFAGLGKVSKSILISEIRDKNGKLLNKFETEKTEVARPEQVYLTLNMMRGVVRAGTGTRARVAGIDIAGKTGTTNDNLDAWFCGITPEMQAIIWYGNDDNKPLNNKEGGSMTAAPVFREFLTDYMEEFPHMRKLFVAPNGVKRRLYNGVDALYTYRSPLPAQNRDAVNQQENENLIF